MHVQILVSWQRYLQESLAEFLETTALLSRESFSVSSSNQMRGAVPAIWNQLQ
jgi:hypothetical protein